MRKQPGDSAGVDKQAGQPIIKLNSLEAAALSAFSHRQQFAENIGNFLNAYN